MYHIAAQGLEFKVKMYLIQVLKLIKMIILIVKFQAIQIFKDIAHKWQII